MTRVGIQAARPSPSQVSQFWLSCVWSPCLALTQRTLRIPFAIELPGSLKKILDIVILEVYISACLGLELVFPLKLPVIRKVFSA